MAVSFEKARAAREKPQSFPLEALKTKKDLAKIFSQSEHTVYNRIREIEAQQDRYPHAVIKDGNLIACIIFAYYDYAENRDRIRRKQLVKPYDPAGIRKALGM